MWNRVLIVDDSQECLEAVGVLLERQGLTVVGVASSGAEAARHAETLRPDVVLVDIFLGAESGLDLSRRLIEDGQSDGATVILISSCSEEEVVDVIAASPAAGFIPKTALSASAIREIVDGRSRS